MRVCCLSSSPGLVGWLVFKFIFWSDEIYLKIFLLRLFKNNSTASQSFHNRTPEDSWHKSSCSILRQVSRMRNRPKRERNYPRKLMTKLCLCQSTEKDWLERDKANENGREVLVWWGVKETWPLCSMSFWKVEAVSPGPRFLIPASSALKTERIMKGGCTWFSVPISHTDPGPMSVSVLSIRRVTLHHATAIGINRYIRFPCYSLRVSHCWKSS